MKPNERVGWAARHYRRIFLAAIVICVLLYYILSSLMPYTNNIEFEVTEGYFVNTTGCRMLALNPVSAASLRLLQRLESKQCTKPQLFEASSVMGKNYLIRIMSEREIIASCKVARISDVSCEYRTIKRQNDFQNIASNATIFRLSNKALKIEVEEGPRILRIRCYRAHNETIYHDVHFFLPELHYLPYRPISMFSAPDHLSIMIIGIDSISHMHYIRTMPLISQFIANLPHVEFWGYNRVGRNSYPNLVPLFTGLNETELEARCYTGQSDYDSCRFLWNHFKAAGFNTSYAEDTSVGGTFNYGKLGFGKQPTDFYLRPVMLEIDEHTRYSIDQRDEIYCSGGRKYAEILHEFIYKLVPYMSQDRFFSFFWQSQGVHDYFNYAQFVDEDYARLFQRFKTQGVFDNTLVLLMSDHGLRYGSFRSTHQGMLEESQPLLIAIYPEWLETEYPLAVANLRYNSHSLVTTFDLHATLKSVTNLKLLEDDNIAYRSTLLQKLGRNMPRGISLFLRIPDERDCDLAGIPSSYCLCHTLSQIPTTDDRSQKAALFVVRNINTMIQDAKLCQILQLKEVLVAYLLNQDNNEFEFEVKVRVQTTPGDGQFEGTTRFNGESLAMNGAVIRTNKYGNQSYCVQNYRIEMYCYCL